MATRKPNRRSQAARVATYIDRWDDAICVSGNLSEASNNAYRVINASGGSCPRGYPPGRWNAFVTWCSNNNIYGLYALEESI